MKISNVTLSTFTDGQDLMTFAFGDPTRNLPYVVQSISGLDAVDIISNFSGFGGGSNAYFDMGLGSRVVVMRLGLNPTYRNAKTAPGLRDQLYKLIAADRSGKVVINFGTKDGKVAAVTGKITKLEANHFNLANEAQLTIECEEGILRSPSVNQVDVSTFGREFIINDCISTAPHGLYAEFELQTRTNDFLLLGPDTTFSIRVRIIVPGDAAPVALPPGTIFKVNSDPSTRSVHMNTGGGERSIIEYVEGFRGSQWPMIYPGRNRFSLVTDAKVTKLEYREAFWGI